ncbi:hypothetical protein BH23VER1_BH23VER1_10690 [soil metagenome]
MPLYPPGLVARSVGAVLLLLTPFAHGFTLRVDLDSSGVTQPGWESLAATHAQLGDSWSREYPGGIAIDVDAIGGVVLDSRDRGTGNGGGAESGMWRDFLFASGSFSTAPGTGLRIAITGLVPNTLYPITLWAFDDGSNGNRRADWSGGGAGPVALTFPDSPVPSSLSEYSVTLEATTDAEGAVTLSGVVAASNPSPSHNVFLNGLEIGDPLAADGPTELAFSATSVQRMAPVGTTVGTFSTTDPTPGDSFVYTLVPGPGDSHNTRFAIAGDHLQTDATLDEFEGGTLLSIRARTTDALGAFHDKVFAIAVIDDSDEDGLDDSWELLYFEDLTVATGDGNNDGDSLTNAEEQARGTNPTLADTDGDGLDDDEETCTGVYVSPTDTGSDPLLVDTDADGINDGDEVMGTFGYVTDPNNPDTDGDGFSDLFEISEGTDPTDAGDFPNTLMPLRLNEIIARNDTGIRDGFGTRDDWIEIYNPNSVPVNLDAYFLTDDQADLTKWNFPAVSIPASGYLVVFASGNDTVDPGGYAHANFRLSAGGEYLAIVRPNGTTIDDSFAPAFPEQFTDVSYGVHPGSGTLVFFGVPTPGAPNATTSYLGVVKDTTFTVDRGFYDAPLTTEIASATPQAAIRYTLDGSPPTPTSGIVYTGPIAIDTTTTLRAIAFRDGWLPTNVDSHTYIFVDDVAVQPADPPGWPTDWSFSSDAGAVVPSDYEMDPRVVGNTLPGYSVREALLDIPSVSIAMTPSDFLNADGEPATGIYSNPLNRTERVCSIEYLLPDGSPGFQEDCKIEIHGNASRRPARMQKHSLRLTFSSSVGPTKLRYPLFPASPVDEFNKLVLRACFTDSWALVSWSSSRYRPNDSQYVRDVWMKESFRAMGQPSSYGRFVHLYVNGLYFGLHDLTERLEDDFYAEHLGGEPEDWEENADFSSPGSRWNAMLALANGDIASPAVYDSIQDYIDLQNYADYMLLHFYADSEDWPTKNGYAAANTGSGDGRFRFFVWDQEIALDKFSWNRYSSGTGGAAPFQRLRLNPEFRILFADRVRRHLFDGGALSLEGSAARYLDITGEIDKAIVAESARWGDVQASTPYGNTAGSSLDPDHDNYPPTLNNPIYFTREQHWVVERDNVVNHYIPILHNESDSRAIVNELRANNLYPMVDAPGFFRYGGSVPRGFELHMDAPDLIYYTTDGSDPRLEGGAVNPAALTYDPATTTVAETLVGTGPVSPTALSSLIPPDGDLALTWTLPEFDASGWTSVQPGDLGAGYERNPPDNYTPAIDRDLRVTMMDQNATAYLRYAFSISGSPDFESLTLAMKYDDGYVAYLNGSPIDEVNAPAQPAWDSSATASHESGVSTFDRSRAVDPDLLRPGLNVLAIHGLNERSVSSDFLVLPELAGVRQVSGNASPVVIDGSRIIRARTLSGGEWSALTESFFSVSDLVVSEIMYHPQDDGAAEFVELLNIGTETVALAGVAFTGGITFDFAGGAVTSLAPGARLLLVRDQAAFEATYGSGLNSMIAGVYGGALDNSGESLRLEGAGGVVLREFTYDDALPWPTAADGGGRSLVLVAPATDPDHDLALNWRPSAAPGGSPGGSDATAFAGDPLADGDGNGRADLLDYAFGSGEAVLTPGMEASSFRYSRTLGADDVAVGIEFSSDLKNWTGMGASLPLTGRSAAGAEEILTIGISHDLVEGTSIFVRLSATLSSP